MDNYVPGVVCDDTLYYTDHKPGMIYNYVYDTSNQTLTIWYDKDSVINLPGVDDFTGRSGYTFKGWEVVYTVQDWPAPGTMITTSQKTYSSQTFNNAIENVYTGDVILTDVWEEIEYEVWLKFEKDSILEGYSNPTDENPDTDIIEFKLGTYTIVAVIGIPTITRGGYNFNSWIPEEGLHNWGSITSQGYNSDLGKYGNVTLEVNWTSIPYHITFDLKSDETVNSTEYNNDLGGVVTYTEGKIEYGRDKIFNLPDSIHIFKPGHTLTGW